MAQGRTIIGRSEKSIEATASTGTRRLAAILAADVAGYSRLMGADEQGTFDRLKALRRQLVDPEDQRASWPHRQDHRRRDAGGIFERRRCGPLRRRDPAGDGRPQRRGSPKTSASPSASGSISATSLSTATIFSATGSTSRRGWRPWPSRAVSASRARCATISATGCPTLSRTLGNKASRTSPSRCTPTH